MGDTKKCPSIYQGIFSNPSLAEKIILITYSLIFIIGLVGNIMTIIIIKYNRHLRTPTNFYLLNLAVSDLMILMCNLPLEMLEIYNREWPLSIVFCKLRNICAEFFTCSSILTILAFSCERYFAVVHPIHVHQLSHFRRAQNVIMIIWLIAFAFSLPFGLFYGIESNPSTFLDKSSTTGLSGNTTKLIAPVLLEKPLAGDCHACLPNRNVAKLLSIIIIIASVCFFYFPMVIIGAIYLFIGQALRRVNKYEVYTAPIEISIGSQSSYSNKETIEMQQQGYHVGSYSWLKMRARCQARKVVFKTLVTVVSAFFVCYAPLYFQRLLVAITTLSGVLFTERPSLSNFMAYLYVISGVTFFLGSVINPILYNVVSNKYRRAFRDLVCCQLLNRKLAAKDNTQKVVLTNRVLAPQFVDQNNCNQTKFSLNRPAKQLLPFNALHKSMLISSRPSHSVSSSSTSRQKKKRADLYE